MGPLHDVTFVEVAYIFGRYHAGMLGPMRDLVAQVVQVSIPRKRDPQLFVKGFLGRDVTNTPLVCVVVPCLSTRSDSSATSTSTSTTTTSTSTSTTTSTSTITTLSFHPSFAIEMILTQLRALSHARELGRVPKG